MQSIDPLPRLTEKNMVYSTLYSLKSMVSSYPYQTKGLNRKKRGFFLRKQKRLAGMTKRAPKKVCILGKEEPTVIVSKESESWLCHFLTQRNNNLRGDEGV